VTPRRAVTPKKSRRSEPEFTCAYEERWLAGLRSPDIRFPGPAPTDFLEASALNSMSRRFACFVLAMAAGGIIYVAGMFVCTMAFNVSLNNALAAVDPASTEAASMGALSQ
jgi:hypothetical protein